MGREGERERERGRDGEREREKERERERAHMSSQEVGGGLLSRSWRREKTPSQTDG